MRTAFLVIVAIVLALLAAAVAPVFKSDPGLVQIHFRGWTMETSVLVLCLALAAAWLLLWLAVRLWRLPAETARRWGEPIAMDPAVKDRVDALWDSLGIPGVDAGARRG